MNRDPDAPVTGIEVARHYRVAPSTVANWIKTRSIEPVDHQGRSPRYRWADMVAAERATRLTQQSSRNEDRLAHAHAA